MAGRGRGGNVGGRPSTFTHDQLQTLIGASKDLSTAVMSPPPIFPILQSKPIPLESNSARDFKILWKEAFLSENQDKIKSKYKNDEFLWDLMPSELCPNFKRKLNTSNIKNLKNNKCDGVKKQKISSINIEEKLKALEQQEQVDVDRVHIKEEPNIKEEKVSDEEDADDEGGEEVDDDMDDDNDYGNSYFDNGDAYNDEDDNLDDGPIY